MLAHYLAVHTYIAECNTQFRSPPLPPSLRWGRQPERMKRMNRFGFFYYSEKRETLKKYDRKPVRNFCKLLNGKVVRYKEWVSKFPFLSTAKWDDTRFVGIGWYDHTEAP